MEGGGCPLESVDQTVDRLDLAVAAKRHHVLARTRPILGVRVTRETLNAGFPGPKHPHVDRVEIRTLAVVGDRPADDQHFRERQPGDLVTGRLGWQEYAIAKPENLLPATRDFGETLWLTALSSPGLTAYCAMEMFGRPMPGQTLVVTSAAGSVGSYAVQLGKLAGMKVVGIAGGPEKCAVVTGQLGAYACLDHRVPDLASRLRETCPEGVHLFFDTVGGWIGDAVFEGLAKFAKVLIVGRTDGQMKTAIDV